MQTAARDQNKPNGSVTKPIELRNWVQTHFNNLIQKVDKLRGFQQFIIIIHFNFKLKQKPKIMNNI